MSKAEQLEREVEQARASEAKLKRTVERLQQQNAELARKNEEKAEELRYANARIAELTAKERAGGYSSSLLGGRSETSALADEIMRKAAAEKA